jgi:trans-aconitate methyltransferase
MSARPAETSEMRRTIDAALGEYCASFTDPMLAETLEVHHERWHLLMAQVAKLIDERVDRASSVRILDIGPRFELDLLHRLFASATVDTLGLDVGLFPARDGERNFRFDLSRTDFQDERPKLGPYEIIVMAEVFEHISMPPSVFMPWLASLLAPGGWLIVQTPNAVALPKRLRMLVGRQPFWELVSDRARPGHFREYTVAELRSAGRRAGLKVANAWTANYFDSPKRTNRLYGRLERITPSSLRAGITVVYAKPENRADG